MNEEQWKLVIDNVGLIGYTCVKYFNKNDEDIYSIGKIGLVKAAQSYNDSKSKFATYAVTCIRNEILMSFRSHRTKKATKYVTISFDIEYYTDKNNICLKDQIAYQEEGYLEVEDKLFYETHCKNLLDIIETKLTANEKHVLKRYYGIIGEENNSLREIGAEINITQSYASRVLRNAMNKIRRHLNLNIKHQRVSNR